jgi:hypothetical protein
LGNSGLYVSKIILGGGSFGDVRYQPWLLDLEDALPLLEYAWKKGINTWDTVSLQISKPYLFHAIFSISFANSIVINVMEE